MFASLFGFRLSPGCLEVQSLCDLDHLYMLAPADGLLGLGLSDLAVDEELMLAGKRSIRALQGKLLCAVTSL
jgi:hypothetical protein